ncbi:hypothetical protein W97_01906 [Coniosporium apollinis CBS 100218]|uniref:BZIP domain-containing protein n=1 Tax=Coniosporium apollinis (strain CBS 100218) TaxID=1168221 RepID=R7YL85_CONA1|nr:uncharacterized protein W97_01906 [Coniosporium apollinis CBS 100218]EON62682.1 hypothetical protein W97_01906 [Coniosporium apollinis CBS 100218]
MSGYNARRGPNVSQYIANLNQVPSAQEMASQKQELFNFDDDLFNNAEFFDFDMGTMADVSQQPIDYDPTQEQKTRRQNASAYRQGAVSKPVNDFLNGDFQFPEFAGLPDVVPTAPGPNFDIPQAPYLHNLVPSATPPTTTSPVSTSPFPVPYAGEKRKLDALSSTPVDSGPIDEAARAAAEEDKRRRNTAASARFRVKKKQREQALEKTAKEMTDKVGALEARVKELETENKWLKDLLVKRNEGKTSAAKENEVERSLGEKTDGVGTGAEGLKA